MTHFDQLDAMLVYLWFKLQLFFFFLIFFLSKLLDFLFCLLGFIVKFFEGLSIHLRLCASNLLFLEKLRVCCVKFWFEGAVFDLVSSLR